MSQQQNIFTSRPWTFSLFITLLSIVSTACGTLKPKVPPMSAMEIQPQPEAQFEPSDGSQYANDTDSELAIKGSRTAAMLASGVTLLAETAYLDPVIRPFSTAKAYYALMLKSAGGIFKRTAISTVNFPLLEQNPIPPVSNQPSMDLDLWEHDLDTIVGTKTALGTISYLVNGDAYFPRLKEAIDNAEDTIDIRTYIFDNDDVGLEMADILREKSGQAKVKVLVDGLGDLFATNLDSKSMPIDTELPSSITEYLKYDSNVKVRRQSNPWLTGDHVKTTIIDQKTAFVGGMNIGREYRYDWHDLMMEVTGPVVNQLQYEFDKAWIKSGLLGDLGLFARVLRGYHRDSNGEGYPIRVISTSIHDSQIYRAQLAAIRRAQNYIYIQNAYFSDDHILYELARARRRGVDVRVIVSSSNDSGAMNLSNEVTINTMLKNGIRVYSYPGMTHVKAAVYDGWACLGSANFDKLSLQVNQEINLGTSYPEAVQQLLDSVFIPDFKASTELHESIPMKWNHRIAELIVDEML
jgi:cardiolipin synthase